MHQLCLRFAAGALFAVALTRAPVHGQLPFFPGAEGYGGTWSGAAPAGGWLSNATVYHVTNLNDSGAGSFRGAFAENTTNKIIVFDVAGTIQLTSGKLDIKNLSNYYIAGQTAPGPVTVYGDMVQLTHSGGKENRNVVLRYLSFRKDVSDDDDAITFAGSGLGTNMILDHVSASWSEDEILSVANNNTNVTVQYTAIHDALVSNHAYGSLIRPRIDSNVSFHHNLYAHNASRQARFGTYNAETLTADFRNNVVYNFRDRASYAGGSGEDEREFADVNYVGNYIIAGPGTTGNATRAFSVDQNMDARVYQSGNFIDSDRTANSDGVPNGANTGWGMFGMGGLGSPVQTLTQMAVPFATAPVTTQSAADAYSQVIDRVGNWWWNRGPIDQRVINNVQNFTGPAIGAAAPNAAELSALLAAPMISRPAGYDTDADGMPDAWELTHGLNPNVSSDKAGDYDTDGYVNVVEYLNEVGAFPAPTPIVFHGATNNRFALASNWRTDDGGVTAGSNWQPSRFDTAVVHNGAVINDALHQVAGTLQIAPSPGDVATFEPAFFSRLEVTQSLEVGGGGAGVVNHSNGVIVANNITLGGAAGASGVYNLSNTGVLRVGSFAKGPSGGQFNFDGGLLIADDVYFDLHINGGGLSPGPLIGETRLHGDLSLANLSAVHPGAISIELDGAGPTQYDRVVVDGKATLAGHLSVVYFDPEEYEPQAGDAFQVLSVAGGIDGMFEFIDLPFLPFELEWALEWEATTLTLFVVADSPFTADFNYDGAVNAADLAIWQSRLGYKGTPFRSLGDANSDGAVDGADFLIWQRQLGSSSPLAAVPEPGAHALALLAAFTIALVRRQLAA